MNLHLAISKNGSCFNDHLCHMLRLWEGDAESAQSPDRTQKVDKEHFQNLVFAKEQNLFMKGFEWMCTGPAVSCAGCKFES